MSSKKKIKEVTRIKAERPEKKEVEEPKEKLEKSETEKQREQTQETIKGLSEMKEKEKETKEKEAAKPVIDLKMGYYNNQLALVVTGKIYTFTTEGGRQDAMVALKGTLIELGYRVVIDLI